MEEKKCCPISQEEGKNLLKNYRPVSLLPIYLSTHLRFLKEKSEKCFLIFFSITKFLLLQTQATHQGIRVFSNPTVNVRGIFLDISKVLHRVCYDGILYN